MNGTILSYKEWLINTKDSVSLEKPYQDYLDYVYTWYDSAFGGDATSKLTANEYANFLITLKDVATDDVVAYIDKIDYVDEDDIKIAIPYFAKKLRKIAKYISLRRDDGKYAIEDYSYLDSNKGISREVYKRMLELYVANTTAPASELSSIIGNASIEIVELYDENEYLDKSPDKDPTDYYDIDSNTDDEYDADYLEWVVSSGFNKLCSDNDLLNPELSGDIPLSGYIDYSPTSEQTTHFKGLLSNTMMGETHNYLSGDEYAEVEGVYARANTPWDNLSNRYYPTVAMIPLHDLLSSKYTTGGFNIPSKLGMSVSLGANKSAKISSIQLEEGGAVSYPDSNVYSDGYSFTRQYQDSPITYNTYLNWIDTKQVSGRGRGILTSTGKYQEMTPYQTSYESNPISFLGMNRFSDNTDPWTGSKDSTWEDDVNYPSDFRNIYDIDEWYSDVASISGFEDQWGVDIYGINYALYKDAEYSNLHDRRQDATGKLYVRGLDGNISTYGDYYSDTLAGNLNGFELDNLTRMDVFNDLIVMEDMAGAVIVQKISFEGGDYIAKLEDLASTLDIELTGGFSPFDYCFDDSTNTLYVGRYESDISGFVEIVVYKYDNGLLVKVYSTRNDTSLELLILRNDYTFSEITLFPSMTISPMDGKLYLTYVAGTTSAHIISIPLIMQGVMDVGEIILVNPTSPGPSLEDYATESRKLIKTVISSDKVILLLEGSVTDSKYLQAIEK